MENHKPMDFFFFGVHLFIIMIIFNHLLKAWQGAGNSEIRKMSSFKLEKLINGKEI